MKRNILATTALLLIVISAILTIIPNTSAAITTFGTTQSGASTSSIATPRGTSYTCSASGPANSINAYLSYTGSTGYFGQQTGVAFESATIENNIRGQAFTTPSTAVIATSISAWITCTTTYTVKAAIYDSSGNLVAQSNQISISAAVDSTRTFPLTSPTLLSASTAYTLVVWSNSLTKNVILVGDIYDCKLAYENGGNGRLASAAYGTFPSTVSFSSQDRNYYVWCNYQTTATKAQCAIYSADGTSRLGVTEELIIPLTSGSWFTFNFNSKPTLNSGAQYILTAWSKDGVNLHYSTTNAQSFAGTGLETYPSWPIFITSIANPTRDYCIYCTVQSPNIVTAIAGAGGTISPSGSVNVANGASQKFDIIPNAGYHITDVMVDGISQGAITSYTFTNVVTGHTITAIYAITQIPTQLTVACTPETVDKTASMDTVVSGILTTDVGVPIAGQQVKLTCDDGTAQDIATVLTQADGSYSYMWTVPRDLANGFYVVTATFEGDSNPYMPSTASTTSASGGGGLFVVPEYALGAFAALGVCLAGFAIVKTRRPNLHQ